MVSVVLWLAVAFQVGLQRSNKLVNNCGQPVRYFAVCVADVCDATWQSTLNSLIISAHVFSDVAFLVLVVSALLCAAAVCCGEKCETQH